MTEDQIKQALEALEKRHNGPGNRMATWKETWAHSYSGEAITKIKEMETR